MKTSEDRSQIALLGVTAMATTLMFLSALPHAPWLVWNVTASAPVGLYRLGPSRDLVRGDLVLAWLRDAAERLAADNGYLPRGVPIIKHIAALVGDRICASGHRITVDGNPSAIRLDRDSMNRPLPRWTGCQTLSGDQVFLLNGNALHSFDGRYFGPVWRSDIIGKLTVLWTP